jgi:hypothetical protein
MENKFNMNDSVTIKQGEEILDTEAVVIREIFVNNYIVKSVVGETISPRELRIYRLKDLDAKYLVVESKNLTLNQ